MIRQFLHVLLLSLACAAHAGPGAHGPNGEHLDAPAGSGATVDARPVIEASTEAFELVGTLAADELSVMVDRYATNEPVLNGSLEVEVNGIKAQGKLHADFGDYSFTDERLLKALHQPGNHALMFTLVAGDESDLIDGNLNVAPGVGTHGLSASWRERWPWVVLLVAVVLAAAAWGARRRIIQKKN